MCACRCVYGGRAEEIVRVLGSAWYGGRVVGFMSFTRTALMQLVLLRLLPMPSAPLLPTSMRAPVCRRASVCSCVSVRGLLPLYTLLCVCMVVCICMCVYLSTYHAIQSDLSHVTHHWLSDTNLSGPFRWLRVYVAQCSASSHCVDCPPVCLVYIYLG